METIYKREICARCCNKCDKVILIKEIAGKCTKEHSEISVWICERNYGRRNKKFSVNN